MSHELVVSGLGVISAIGQGKDAFLSGLLEGRHAFSTLQRVGRQQGAAVVGAEITNVVFPNDISPQTQRAASLTAQLALVTMHEAWEEARLSAVDPERVGLIVGGSNVQQRELTLVHDVYQDKRQFLRPSYALSFMDTDVCGFCTEQFGVRGIAYAVGGASASGQLAIVHAAQAILNGQADACIAIGALMDLSYWECQGLRALGAMGSDRYAESPQRACRPFDRDRDGFIFGESCGAIVIETAESAARRGVRSYGVLQGWGMCVDGNRNPDPSLAGEIRAIRSALRSAGWSAAQIDYVNPHGTGSIVGDETELQALRSCELNRAYINATKSLIGHGLSAAGTVEAISTLLQMRAGYLHPTQNLDNPIDAGFNWVRGERIEHRIGNALTLSMGFGGLNTALCWRNAIDENSTR